MNYEQGLERLKQKVQQQEFPSARAKDTAINEFLIYEMRLQENLYDSAQFGTNPTLEHDRTRLVLQLNDFARRIRINQSFEALCQ